MKPGEQFVFDSAGWPVILVDQSGVVLRAKNQQNWAQHATRLPQFRHYFGNPHEGTSRKMVEWRDGS